ncbi:hypothetical protein ElyMa_005798000 [Elysia marginata]|uniref:Uncharacterized protein n=1 Tax=Elysia marginata TaxID=1093978 RepID=A0AAV4FU05_9GAST|nr:hypothetical protein ElyMa_005798000 [Elysia marginata]
MYVRGRDIGLHQTREGQRTKQYRYTMFILCHVENKTVQSLVSDVNGLRGWLSSPAETIPGKALWICSSYQRCVSLQWTPAGTGNLETPGSSR